ncbi:hypothetical protein ABTG62_18510, partial [Acinetobacter baumannii]
ITELLYKENDVVPIDAVIARIQTAGNEPAAAPAAVKTTPAAPENTPTEEIKETPAEVVATQIKKEAKSHTARFYSPLVLNIAAQEGIPLAEL